MSMFGWQQYAEPGSFIPAPAPSFTPAPTPAPSTPATGGGLGGFGNFFGSPAGMMAATGVNSFIGGFGQAQAAQSAQNAQDASMAMFDAGLGRSLFDRNYDYYLQRKAPIDEARIKMNPTYRRGQTRDVLLNPGLAGRYSAFIV
jgi:hypothetical protein